MARSASALGTLKALKVVTYIVLLIISWLSAVICLYIVQLLISGISQV